MTPADFARWGLAWPAPHPDTGEPFTEGTFTRNMNRQMVRWPRPMRPDRQVVTATEWVTDEDGYDEEIATAWRDLSDAEWAEVTASYDAAVRRWDETGGIAFTAGRPETTGTFTTASGASASGTLDGDAWYWHETESGQQQSGRTTR